jgi:hypothetical protein
MEKKNITLAIQKLMDDENNYPIICELAVSSNGDKELYHNFAHNLAKSILTLKNLAMNLEFTKCSDYEIYRIFLPQIYLICEELFLILRKIKYDNIYEKIPFISRIKKLMNFLKHPKMKGFFKEPNYLFLDDSKDVPHYLNSEAINFFIEKHFEVLSMGAHVYIDENNNFLEDVPDEFITWSSKEDGCHTKKAEWVGMTNEEKEKMMFGHLDEKIKFVFTYFSEKDIIEFYSTSRNDEEKLGKFCQIEGLLIILPTISSLVNDLHNTLTIFIEIFESDSTLFELLEEFSSALNHD